MSAFSGMASRFLFLSFFSFFSLCVSSSPSAFEVKVVVDLHRVLAKTNASMLTSVDIDICSIKEGLPLNDTRLQKLAAHIGGSGTVLRVGGSDQNSMDYDLNRTDLPPPCACGQRCTMTLGVWRQLLQFAQASGHRLLFGLAPKTDMALDLIRTAQNDSVFAYTFGNEINSAALFDGYKQIRALLDDGSVFPDKEGRPLLAGPDVALQRHASLEDALAGRDATIMSALAWVETFAQEVGDTLDALSFHTYDFETAMLGTHDHAGYHPEQVNASRLYNTRYLDFAERLLGNVTDRAIRHSVPQVWLTETNSICHQGLRNGTDAYINSVWLVNRLGLLASHNLSFVGRQTLVGYNYSLLGNWPQESLFDPRPDYYTTLLFRKLVGPQVLPASVDFPAAASQTWSELQGARARAYAYCRAGSPGDVTLTLLNFDNTTEAKFSLDTVVAEGDIRRFTRGDGASRLDFLLTPAVAVPSSEYAWTSRNMALNGLPLNVTADGDLPPLEGRPARLGDALVLPPLTVAFVVLTGVNAPACR